MCRASQARKIQGENSIGATPDRQEARDRERERARARNSAQSRTRRGVAHSPGGGGCEGELEGDVGPVPSLARILGVEVGIGHLNVVRLA